MECLIYQIRMFILIWAIVLFAVRRINANTVEIQGCQDGSCFTLIETTITAGAGLCVAIPCSIKTNDSITDLSVSWYKCKPPKQNCSIILDSKNNTEAFPEFSGRVSLLTNLSQKNCSIIISNLTETDSGSYHLRVDGIFNGTKVHMLSNLANITIKALSQKPTVIIPPLTVGQQTTLTCTAPGLCSGSHPEITWMWRGSRQNDTHITGNITVKQGQTSTLTFNLSAEHHGTKITCKVSFRGNVTTEKTVTLNVTLASPIEIEGCQNGPCITLTKAAITAEAGLFIMIPCSFMTNDSITDLSVIWYKCKPPKQNCSIILDSKNNTEALPEFSGRVSLLTNLSQKNCSIIISNLTETDSGSYHLRVDGIFNGTKVYMLSNLANITIKAKSGLHNSKGNETHPTSTAEKTGHHICTAKHPNTTLYKNETLVLSLRVLNSTKQLAVLTCMCNSEEFPLPTIKWRVKLENHIEYSLITTVSNHTVNCTVSLSITDNSNTTGIGSKNNGVKHSTGQDLIMKLLETIKQPAIIYAFLIGVLLSTILSTIVCCLMRKSHRKKQKTYGNLAGTLEMETYQKGPLINNGHEVEDDQTNDQEAAEGGGAVAAGKSDGDYSTIDFSKLKRAKKEENSQEAKDSEYAEIKRKEIEEEQDGEGNQEAVLIEEADMPEEGEGEDVALYPDVKDIVSEI